MRFFSCTVFLVAQLVAAVCTSGPVAAQTESGYPERPIRVIVPSAAGGAPDTLTRYVTGELARALGRPFIVDNKPGAAGQLAMRELASAAPDGYTIAYANVVTHAINRSLVPRLSYDPEKDTSSIALVAFTQNALVVRKALGVTTVAELIALAKRQPGKLTFASAGNGTTSHLSAELFKLATQTDITHVPYKGSPQAINDLLGANVDIMFDNLASITPHIKSGGVKALAVTGEKRSALLADLPTMQEAGVRDVVAVAWGGFVAPAGTPVAIIDRLNAAINTLNNTPESRARLAAMGFEPYVGKPSEFTVFAKQETAKWAEVVRRSGAKMD